MHDKARELIAAALALVDEADGLPEMWTTYTTTPKSSTGEWHYCNWCDSEGAPSFEAVSHRKGCPAVRIVEAAKAYRG